MEWPRIKSVLIILFLFVNGFLLFSMGQNAREKYEISPSVQQDVVTVLEKQNILISPQVLPQKRQDCENYLLAWDEKRMEEMGKLILGEGLEIIEEEETYELKGERGELTFQKPLEIAFSGSYYSGKLSTHHLAEDFLAIFCGEGIEMRQTLQETQEETGATDYFYSFYKNGMRLSDSWAQVRIEEKKVVFAKGNIPFFDTMAYEELFLSDPVTALLRFATTKEEEEKPTEIERVEPVYVWNQKDSSVFLVCGYEIEEKEGKITKISADGQNILAGI